MAKEKVNIKDIPLKLKGYVSVVGHYRVLIFVLCLIVIYGYSTYEINSLSNQQPSETQIQAETNPISAAHVDNSVVDQLQALQNNSVSVQALFEQTRTNPFQEP